MGHTHAHDHGPHADTHLTAAVAVNVLLTVVQVAGGLASGSLALIADALHNLSDAASLVIALAAGRIARRPADHRRTFGYRRAEVIGALINLTALIIVGLYLVYEALARLVAPEPVAGWTVVIIAAAALLVDVATAALVYRSSRSGMNIRAAFIHNVADALGSVGVIVAGALIILYDWRYADPIATILIAGYVLYQGLTMIRGAIRILMESTPADIDVHELAAAAAEVPGVLGVHHVHVWQIDELSRAAEAHIVIERTDAAESERIKVALRELLARRYGITHTTLELESPGEAARAGVHRTDVITPH